MTKFKKEQLIFVPEMTTSNFCWTNHPFVVSIEKAFANRQIIITIDAFIDAADK
jgi:hypothetical protein